LDNDLHRNSWQKPLRGSRPARLTLRLYQREIAAGVCAAGEVTCKSCEYRALIVETLGRVDVGTRINWPIPWRRRVAPLRRRRNRARRGRFHPLKIAEECSDAMNIPGRHGVIKMVSSFPTAATTCTVYPPL